MADDVEVKEAESTEAPSEDSEDESKSEKKFQRTKEEELFLSSGVHIGTQQKSQDMMPFIFRVRNDGLYVLDIKMSVDRIRKAARLLAQYEPENILAVSARQYGQQPVESFAQIIGTKYFAGRFIPGTLTNHNLRSYIEPEIIVVTDPFADVQALRESIVSGIPVIAFCDANNETKYVDLVIPANNKGRKALATLYWQLTKNLLLESERIKDEGEFDFEIEDFEATI